MSQAIHTPWWVAMIGRREHYLVPRALADAGLLGGMYTDAWERPGRLWSRAVTGRYHPALADARIADAGIEGLCRTALWRAGLKAAPTPEAASDASLWFTRWFARRSARWLEMQRATAGVVFGYNHGMLELSRVARRMGLSSVMMQAQPGPIQDRIVDEQRVRFPGAALQANTRSSAYWERVRLEWQTVDRIIVNSGHSFEGLVQAGVPEDKVRIVPLALDTNIEGTAARMPDQVSAESPLRVLWLGAASLTKGFPQFLEAARQLANAPVVFDVVGPLLVNLEALGGLPPGVRLHGRVPGAEVSAHYRQAHVFAFPTLTDGFGMTQLEAMAHGLPVIATPRCGALVRHGVNGWLVQPGESGALAQAVEDAIAHPRRLAAMGRAAKETASRANIRSFQQELLAATEGLGS